MGATSCSEEQFDREQDPKTIARRHELYNKYVAPFYNMIYKLVIQYSFSTQYVEENYNEVLVMTQIVLFVHGCILLPNVMF